MAKKNRVHVNYRLHPDTDKAIRKYAKKRGISEGFAVDQIVACAFMQISIKTNTAQPVTTELVRFDQM